MSQQVCTRATEGSPLFSYSAISSHLQHLGYPEQSIKSIERCGTITHQIAKFCPNCKPELINIEHHCNLRTCPTCSLIRKRRLYRQYLPFLKHYKCNQKDFLYFLTISPQNFSNIEEGQEIVKKSFSKFIRAQYVKERIKAGIYVLETKESEDGSFNIHLHCIVYGRWLDNVIRGHCFKCKQNRIKFDRFSKKYYCANRKCNSLDVKHNQDSKIVTIFKKCSGLEVNIDIRRISKSYWVHQDQELVHFRQQTDVKETLNYMLKYVSVGKESFSTSLNFAKYIHATRKRKLINTFGLFYKLRPQKLPPMCKHCGSTDIIYCSDFEIVKDIREKLESGYFEDPPPDLTFWFQKT